MSPQTINHQLPPDLGLRLGMKAGADKRLQQMPPAPDVELPDETTAKDLMEFCSISADDAAAMCAARPDPEHDPDWWWLLRGSVAELRQRMGKTLPASGYRAWPTVPDGCEEVGMFLYAWALLTVVPDVLEIHRRHGIPESVSRDSLLALGGVMNSHHQVTGRRGVGYFPLWGPPQYFSGIEFILGRHSFTRAQLGVGGRVAANVLMVHIPPFGRLDEEESRQSIDRAIELFASNFADEPVAALVCISWVLDPQLAEYLRPESNLLRFQRRFQLLPRVPTEDESDGDREMMRHGLEVIPPDGALTEADLLRIPQDTTLQRAFVAHLRAGRHWHNRIGMIWLTDNS